MNDANAAAVAELTFGTGESTNLLVVRVDQGVGAGLVLDGSLFRGAFSAAGEIGHVVVDPDGELCACGKRGCLETEIAAPALAELLADVGSREIDVLRCAGERLGAALAPVISALDLTDVVLSGPEPILSETFRSAAVRELAARTMPEIGDRLVIRPSGRPRRRRAGRRRTGARPRVGHPMTALATSSTLLGRQCRIRPASPGGRTRAPSHPRSNPNHPVPMWTT